MLTPRDEIKGRLASYNLQYYDCLSREIAALWNIDSSAVLGGTSGGQAAGTFPIWPRIDVQPRRTTEQRPILETTLKVRSRVLSTDPIPEFSGIDEVHAEIRQKFWSARAEGDHDSEADWYSEIRQAFVDGDALGVGVLQIGVVTDTKSGEQKVTVRHLPVRQVIWDATEENPRRSRWVAFCDYMDVDEAVQAYGEDHVRPHITRLPTGTNGKDPEIIPVWHYYDVGSKKSDPTYACVIGDLANNPFKVQKNPFGVMLPVSWMVGELTPGYQRPVGRVAQMLGSQLALNQQLTRLSLISQTNPGFIVIKGTNLDPKQMDLVRQGVPNVVIETEGDINGVPAVRVSGGEASSTDLSLLQEHKNELARQGGLSDLDRGTPFSESKTATEVGYIQSGVEQSQSSTVLNTLSFLKETMEKVFIVASLYDRSPVMLNILGYPVQINGSDPRSSIDRFLEDPGQLVLTSEALTGQDARVKQAERQHSLEKLLPLAAAGQINRDVWTEEYLKSIGERNTDRWMPRVEQTPVGQPSGDQMGQGINPQTPMQPTDGGPPVQAAGSMIQQSA